MPAMQRINKPKTFRGKRHLLQREPKLTENTKTSMFLRSNNCSQTVINCMKDLIALKKPYATYFNRKRELRPFEDISELEYLGRTKDSSLFFFGSSNKKRPDNAVIGRFYDFHLLDMIELGIEAYKGLGQFKVGKVAAGIKPCLLFVGEPFDTQPEYQRLKSLFIDFFRGDVVKGLRLAGLEHVLLFAAIDEKIHFRSYKILMKKSGTKVPRIELEEIGPHMDFTMRRTRLASDDLYKRAKRTAKELKKKKIKNVSRTTLGSKLGRIHMQKQNMNKLQMRKLKGLKKTPEEQRHARKFKRKAASGAAAAVDARHKRTNLHFDDDDTSWITKRPRKSIS